MSKLLVQVTKKWERRRQLHDGVQFETEAELKNQESLVLLNTKMRVDGLDVPDVKAEVVNFQQKKRLHSESLVLSMPMTVYDLDVKAEVAIFHQKELHSDLKYFDDQIHLQAQLPNLGVVGTYCN